MLAVSVGSPACTEDSPRGLEGSRSRQPECEAASSGGCPPGPAPASLFNRHLDGLDLPSQRAALGHSHRPPGPPLRPRRRPASPPPNCSSSRSAAWSLRPSRTPSISAACGRGPAGTAPSAGDSGIHNSDCRAGPSSRPAPRSLRPSPVGVQLRKSCQGDACAVAQGAPSAPPWDGALLCTSGPRTAQPELLCCLRRQGRPGLWRVRDPAEPEAQAPCLL